MYLIIYIYIYIYTTYFCHDLFLHEWSHVIGVWVSSYRGHGGEHWYNPASPHTSSSVRGTLPLPILPSFRFLKALFDTLDSIPFQYPSRSSSFSTAFPSSFFFPPPLKYRLPLLLLLVLVLKTYQRPRGTCLSKPTAFRSMINLWPLNRTHYYYFF